MTWLKGSTSWGALPQLINQLLCGEVADGSSNYLASGDQWVREFSRVVTDGVLNSTTTLTSATAAFTAADKGAWVYGPGIPAATTIASVTNSTTVVLSAPATTTASGVTIQIAFDTIRTKASMDVPTGTCGMRTGYWALIQSNSDFTMTNTRSPVCRISTPFTSVPATSAAQFNRWIVFVNVVTANTVANNYSNAVLSAQIYDLDSGTLITNTTVSVNSAGVSGVIGGNGMVVTVSDPTGILLTGTSWRRAFTSTYMYGIDHIPMLYRLGSGSMTFPTALPGTQGTDWDIVQAVYDSTGSAADRGNALHGIGIKTATGLGAPGALYSVSFPMAAAKIRIFTSSSGRLSLDVGQARNDTTNGSVIRNAGGFRIQEWLRCASTLGTAVSSTAVQYWMSVKADGIALMVNMDPGATGGMGSAWFGSFIPVDTTYDCFPFSFNEVTYAYTGNQNGGNGHLSTQYEYFVLKRHQDGSEGSRDWQTKWCRCEHIINPVSSGMMNTDVTTASSNGNTGQPRRLNAAGWYSSQSSSGLPITPVRQTKPNIEDGKWWMYGAVYTEGEFEANAGNAIDETRNVRGTQNTRYFYIPGDNWSNGDELTDTSTSQKYMLVAPDYVGLGMRVQYSTGTYLGGMAIAEM